MEKKNIIIFFGGCSSEYSVSLESAAGVIRNLDREQYCPIPVGITRQGDWYYYTGTVEQIAADTWYADSAHCVPAALSPAAAFMNYWCMERIPCKKYPWTRRCPYSMAATARTALFRD